MNSSTRSFTARRILAAAAAAVSLAAIVAALGCSDHTASTPVPADLPVAPTKPPFALQRQAAGEPVSDAEVAAFTKALTGFYRRSNIYHWIAWHSHGLAEGNQWGQPAYRIWWTGAKAIKSGDVVTFRHDDFSDNTSAKVGRILPALIGAYLANPDDDPVLKELLLHYIRGLSATFDGAVWPDENPPTTSIMVRAIYHRNHSYTMEGDRKVTIDYEPARIEESARRHDNLHNPDNPTWGDIWVRNKRSKDDFPYLFRDAVSLSRLIAGSPDTHLRDAAITYFRQLRAMAADIVDHGYVVRTKGPGGVVYIPYLDEESGVVDDFASFTNYETLWPRAECSTKLAAAFLAHGSRLDNDCGDGSGGGYEAYAIATHYWSSNMIWGYHLTAAAMALLWNDTAAARELLDGFASRLESLMSDSRADSYTEWFPDLASLLVLGAAYGLPLTNDEARFAGQQYAAAAEHFDAFGLWDLWDASIPDGEYSYLPDRSAYDADGAVKKSFVRIEEILDVVEYCASPLKDPAGARFIDCDVVLDPSRWGE